MNSKSSVLRTIAFIVVATFVAHAFADPPDFLSKYRFVPSKTSVHVTGGSPAYDLNLTIAGSFGMVTGYDEVVSPTGGPPSLVPHAEFIDVHGILYNPLGLSPLPLPGWDLDKTLNLSGLKGTFNAGDPNDLFFHGGDGAGVAMLLQANITGPWLHLTGGSSDPIGKNPVLYRIDALAHVAPFPDFNQDGSVTTADIPPMLAALAQMNATSAASSFANTDVAALGDVNGDGAFTNADVQALLDNLKSVGGSMAAVPEPSAIYLLAIAAAISLLVGRRPLNPGKV